MKKNISDASMPNKNQEENEHNDDYLKDSLTEKKTLRNCTSNEFNNSSRQSVEKNDENQEKVAEKVEGVTSFNTPFFSSSSDTHADLPDTNPSSSSSSSNVAPASLNISLPPSKSSLPDVTSTSTTPTAYAEDEESILSYNVVDAEELVRDIENHLQKKLSPRERKFVNFIAEIHMREGRAITVKDVMKNMEVKQDYAEKMIYKATRAQILATLAEKHGKMNLYALINYKHILDSRPKRTKEDVVLSNDITLILARQLSQRKYKYHNIELATSLNYKEDYDQIEWPIKSSNNKQKVAEFRLEPRRSCSFTVSPNGTVSIFIECTHQPYRFHTPAGLVSFFATCGQIFRILQDAPINRFNVIPTVEEWNLLRFDYNKDIPTIYLKEKFPSISWSSKGVLKLKHLGAFFQVYSKHMPFEGECLRFEGHYTCKKENLVDKVGDIVDEEKHPFTTVEEMLEEKYKNENTDCNRG